MPDSPDRRPTLASDAERDHGVALLRDAAVEGRLSLEEFSERVDRAQSARTGEELALLTRDLPAATPAPGPSPGPEDSHRAFCSRIVRSGPQELPQRSSWRSIFGTINLDLREARLSSSETELEVYNLFGTVTVIVPEGVALSVVGGGLFASQVIQPPKSAPVPGAPRLRIRISGPGGTLYVRSEEPRSRLARLLGNQ